jgi:beta-galactosidase
MLKGDYSMNTITAAGDDLWETVQLPHDWAISRGPEKGESMKNYGRYPLPGTYWYRKSFELPEANQGKRIVLEFDEAMQDATVYLNGTQVGR